MLQGSSKTRKLVSGASVVQPPSNNANRTGKAVDVRKREADAMFDVRNYRTTSTRLRRQQEDAVEAKQQEQHENLGARANGSRNAEALPHRDQVGRSRRAHGVTATRLLAAS
jgi:hypothetical protein